jgi:two-component system OmpR family sensor kinase
MAMLRSNQIESAGSWRPWPAERRQGSTDRRLSTAGTWPAERRRGLRDRRLAPWPAAQERRYRPADRRSSFRSARTLPTPMPLTTDLLPLVSHELRTPITSIQGYAELLARRLRQRGADRDLLEPAAVIGVQVRRLNAIVSELLDLSELSNADARLRLARVNLEALTRQAAVAMQATAPGHTLHVEATPSLAVWGDGARLRQLVDHLLHNAVKYSPEGGEIRLRAWESGDNVCLAVQDAGIGIAPEHLDRVFDAFYQTEPPTQRHFGGLGLGLTLCRAIVERHGGTIWVESTPGQGSTFYVQLPRAKPRGPDA